MSTFTLGESIPPDTAHALSVSLPTWHSNIGYEEGQEWVVSRMTTGYPRFFIHKIIEAFAQDIVATYGQPSQQALLYPTAGAARRCLHYMRQRVSTDNPARFDVIDLTLDVSKNHSPTLKHLSPTISCVVFPLEDFPLARQYWQHTGEGVSSRRAEFCYDLFKQLLLIPSTGQPSCSALAKPFRGPKRYSRPGSIGSGNIPVGHITKALSSVDSSEEPRASSRFLEERFGRNLDLSLVGRAKSAIRRRIVGLLVPNIDLSEGSLSFHRTSNSNSRGIDTLEEDHVYLFPTGMNAIFTTHRALLAIRGSLKSINFGFSYVDTLKILQKFGPGCIFFGCASAADLDRLERLLRSGQRYLALFCEFPGNPLLTCPDLERIRQLADKFDFALVIDETIGTFANINILQLADIVVSSLTKIFSGDSNVMGGCAILNPESKYYDSLNRVMREEVYEDTYWPEDIVFMERNSRDFATRVKRINANAEAICDILSGHALVKRIYYPKHNPSRPIYDAYRLPSGGYGGLLSVVFVQMHHAQVFYDNLETAKGPSLGTNFTLCSPYVLLAHYHELSWAAQFGVDANLVRVSVGLEETDVLQETFRKALEAAVGAVAYRGG